MTNRDRAIWTGAWSLIISGIAVIAILAINPMGASASTTHPTPSQVTCKAFSAWERHETAGNLRRLAADSFSVPWRYLGDDVWGLYADVRSGSVKYVHADIRYIQEDCSS